MVTSFEAYREVEQARSVTYERSTSRYCTFVGGNLAKCLSVSSTNSSPFQLIPSYNGFLQLQHFLIELIFAIHYLVPEKTRVENFLNTWHMAAKVYNVSGDISLSLNMFSNLLLDSDGALNESW